MTNLLVVDDESATRRLVAYTLKSLRIEVTGAESGAEALRLAADGDFKLILLDINLPKTDGFTLLTMLRALPSLVNVPIIMFTARSNPKDEMRASELGANGFLYKPFTTAELRTLVTTYMSKVLTQETPIVRPDTVLEPRLLTPISAPVTPLEAAPPAPVSAPPIVETSAPTAPVEPAPAAPIEPASVVPTPIESAPAAPMVPVPIPSTPALEIPVAAPLPDEPQPAQPDAATP